MSSAELVPAFFLAPLDLRAAFGRYARLEVDLGCGDGAFLLQRARQFPERNFLGVERLRGRVGTAARKFDRADLANARVVRVDTRLAVEHLLAAGSVSMFYLLFPDPWPKRRHESRRIFTAGFLTAVAEALTDDGVLHFATDQREYFDAGLTIATNSGLFSWHDPEEEFPITTFERHFRAKNLPIYRALMRKISPVTNARASHPASVIRSSTAPVSS